MQNPDLIAADHVAKNAALAAAAAGATEADLRALVVQPTKALTAPFPQTLAENYAYFKCSLLTASCHREDGKKLPFVNGVLKTNIIQDIAYLRKEIYEHQNPYFEEADSAESIRIEAILNPREAMKRQVRAEVEAEVATTLGIERAKMESEIRARLMAEMAGGTTDAGKIAGVDAGNPAVALTAAQRTGQVQVMPLPGPGVVVLPLNPVTSASIADATAGGESAAARAAAALAALKK